MEPENAPTVNLIDDRESSAMSTVTRLSPLSTAAATALQGRVLMLVSSNAFDAMKHIDTKYSGIVITGAKALDTVRVLKRHHPQMVVAVEPTSITKYIATASHPFDVAEGDGMLIPLTLGEVLAAQARAGATVTVTPTGYIAPGESQALKAAIELGNKETRDDMVLLLPVHHLWLSKNWLTQLIAVARLSIHPVALIVVDSYQDPLSNDGAVEGYRTFFRQVPGAIAWRTDLAGFDALAHGAIAASIGFLPSIRRGFEPNKGSNSSDPNNKSPHLLIPKMLRYTRSSVMREQWFASSEPIYCSCIICSNRALDSYTTSDEDRLQAHLHNLVALMQMRRDLGVLTGESIYEWWRELVIQALVEHETLSAKISVKIGVPEALKSWAA